METDEMELDTVGDRRTALFVIISDTDDTQLCRVYHVRTFRFSTCYATKPTTCTAGGATVHVRCLLDEFANIGQIPKFEKLVP